MPFVYRLRFILQRHFQLASIGILLFVNIISYPSSFNHPFMIDDGIYMQSDMSDIKYLPYHLIPDQKMFFKAGQQKQNVYYRPGAHVFFLLERLVWKDNVIGYHLTSFILFFISEIFLLFFLAKVFQSRALAFLTTLFYAVHPVNGFLVNYKTAVYFSIMMIFLVSSLWLLWRAQNSHRSYLWYGGSLIGFSLALLSHETAVALPFYTFGLLYFRQKLKFGRAFLRNVPYVLLLFLFLLFRMKFSSLEAGYVLKYL